MVKQDSESVFNYIFGLTIPGVKLELSRVKEFMSRLGTPHTAYPIIHIAGTNGKGSTAAMLAAVLSASGKKTGLFTSPHLIKPNERIRIGNALITDEFIIEHVEAWQPHIDELGITFFEVLTALGMEYFKQHAVDYAVIETGLGGRLDATNVVDPILSIITSVSMDHENILGDNLATIAGEKAGIIKPLKPVILGQNPDIVRQVMLEKCKLESAPLTYVPDEVRLHEVNSSGVSQKVRMSLGEQTIEIELPLLGSHQIENFSNVLMALSELDVDLDNIVIQKGLDKMVWQGRMQVLDEDPLVLYDVAHNPEGLDRLLQSLRETDHHDAIIVAAFNARKNIGPMLSMLNNWSGDVIFSAFEGHSAVDGEALLHMGIKADMIATDLKAAYQYALDSRSGDNQPICFIGSHYMAETLFPMFGISTSS